MAKKEKEEILEVEVKNETQVEAEEVKEQPAKKLFSSKEKGTRLS